jgi:hypothetical protein
VHGLSRLRDHELREPHMRRSPGRRRAVQDRSDLVVDRRVTGRHVIEGPGVTQTRATFSLQ